MNLNGSRIAAGVAGLVVTAPLGVGIAAGQSGDAASAKPLDIDPSCVLGVTAVDIPPGAEPWELGLMARSDGLDRRYRLGRYAEGGECADVPDWFTALIWRSDGLSRQAGLGPYAR